MLEIWTGLQLLTSTLAPIQESCSTSFFSSHQEDEVRSADRRSPNSPHCGRLWAESVTRPWLLFSRLKIYSNAVILAFFSCIIAVVLRESFATQRGSGRTSGNFHSENLHQHLLQLWVCSKWRQKATQSSANTKQYLKQPQAGMLPKLYSFIFHPQLQWGNFTQPPLQNSTFPHSVSSPLFPASC